MAKGPRSLAGKVVAITGGGRGIGRATAAALIAEGARVAIGDIESELAARTAAELGAGTLGLALDVTDSESFGAFLDTIERELGPLDVLVNNAGIMPLGPFAAETEATADRLVAVNLNGVLIGSKLALVRFLPPVRPAFPVASPTARPSTRSSVSARRSAPSTAAAESTCRSSCRRLSTPSSAPAW
jgi:NAD(P)-dependent dehydrogenase (short-subunit alcohol dehydrogenase family)